ncbi:UNVERIFIED_CONTAM: putative ribonuclease H protein [Sesamum radiatum]|uniref:Ribonuclease H protein n=1 Tax=Sesamum radiatum TaxID=300843 RepID=A0AAW2L002_SESRA
MEIADIPFDEEEVDRPWWKGQSDGAFSIKSAWNLERMPGIRRPLFNELWHSTVMPSMSIFAWRLLNNFIPVDARLKEKGMVIVSKCCCCENIETIEHVFLNSSSVKEVWNYFGNLFNLQPPQTDFISIMFQFWKLSSPDVKRGHVRLLIPLLIFWFIWMMRNEAKFNDVCFTSSAIIRRVMAYLWKLYKAKCFKLVHWRGDLLVAKKIGFIFHSPSPTPPILCRWLPPPNGFWKLNSDGASKGNPGPLGAGGLIRDSRGKLIMAYYDFLGDQTNTFAELYGVSRGLHFAWELGCHNVWVELDAIAIIRIILTERELAASIIAHEYSHA